MSLDQWFALFATCIALAVSPGPSSTFALSTSIRHGHHAGVKAVMGSTLGFASLILIALVGLTAIVSTLPLFILGLKWVGAIYLVWLAFQLWFHTAASEQQAEHLVDTTQSPRTKNNAMLRGFLIALSNPKIVLFWLAFIPSILVVDSLKVVDIAIVIATFALIEACAELLLVWLGAKAQRYLHRHMRGIDRGSAVIFIGFALVLVGT